MLSVFVSLKGQDTNPHVFTFVFKVPWRRKMDKKSIIFRALDNNLCTEGATTK